MVVFDHWVPLGWWDMPDFFPEIFAEALVTFTMSASGPLYLGGRASSKSYHRGNWAVFPAQENSAPEIVCYVSAVFCHRTRNCSR